MNTCNKFKEWVTVLRGIMNEYSGKTIDNIIVNLEMRIKELSKKDENNL